MRDSRRRAPARWSTHRCPRIPTATIPAVARSSDSRSSWRLCASRNATVHRWWASRRRASWSDRSGTVWMPATRSECDAPLPAHGQRQTVAVEHLRDALALHDGDHLLQRELFDELREAPVDEARARLGTGKVVRQRSKPGDGRLLCVTRARSSMRLRPRGRTPTPDRDSIPRSPVREDPTDASRGGFEVRR